MSLSNTQNIPLKKIIPQQQKYYKNVKFFPVISSFMTYHKVCNQANRTGITSGAGTAYPSGAHLRFLVGFVLLDLQFYAYALQINVCPFVLFLLAIVLSVLLRYTDSDYPFGSFKVLPFKKEGYCRITCLSGATFLSVDCCTCKLELQKFNLACLSSTKQTSSSSSSHRNVTCSRR